jgi:hypothetical protein
VRQSQILEAKLNPDATDLIPIGHQRPWDSFVAAEVICAEIQAECYGSRAAENETIVLRVAFVNLQASAAKSGTPGKFAGGSILDLNLQPNEKRPAELSFRIEPPPADPFATSGDGDVRIVLSNGREILAFYDQPVSSVNDGGASRSIEAGRPHWRAFLPANYSGEVTIVSGERSWKIANVAPSPPVPAAEFDGERWNAPAVVPAPVKPPSWASTRTFWRLDQAGEWQISASEKSADLAWRPVAFWNENWGGYAGTRHPNFAQCARMDTLLAKAAANGTRQPLIILPGETLEGSDTFNWHSHPLNGPLPGPGSVYADESGFEFCKRWIRYTVARWGSSPAVQGLWISTALNTPAAPPFHSKLGHWLKTLPNDPATPFVSLDPLVRPLPAIAMIETFEKPSRTPFCNWHIDHRIGPASATRQEPTPSYNMTSLELRAEDTALTSIGIAGTYQFGAPPEITTADAIAFDVCVPIGSPPDLRAGVHFCDCDGNWFDALLPEQARAGDWNTYLVDISPSNRNGLRNLISQAEWSGRVRERLTEIGIHVYSAHPNWSPEKDKPRSLAVRIGNVRAIRFSPEKTSTPALIQTSTSANHRWPPEIVQTLLPIKEQGGEVLNGWHADARLGMALCDRRESNGPDHGPCFELQAGDARTTAIGLVGCYPFGTPGNLQAADTLLFDVWVPGKSPADLRVGIHLIDGSSRWFEALLLAPPVPNEWTTYAVDLSKKNANQLHELGDTHGPEAHATIDLRKLFEVGIHLYSTHPNWIPRNGLASLNLTTRIANVRMARMSTEPRPAIQDENDDPYGQPQRVASLADGQGAYDWEADLRCGAACRCTEIRSDDKMRFTVQANDSDATTICLTGRYASHANWSQVSPDNLFAADALVFDVFTPREAPPDMRVGVHLRDRNGQWYETLLPPSLCPGDWVRCAVDLTTANTHHLKAVSHDCVWNDYTRQRIGEIGIHVYSQRSNSRARAGQMQPISFRVHDIHTVTFEALQIRKVESVLTLFDPATQQHVKDPTASPFKSRLNVGELWECNVQVNKTFANPFDPTECDLSALIFTPSGKRVRVPAFFNQVCKRREAKPGGDEIVEPTGQEFFTVRYRVVEKGAHAVTLELREGGKYETAAFDLKSGQGVSQHVKFVSGRLTGTLAVGAPAFTANSANKPFHGFIRTAADKRHVEFTDGTFFYPIGPCLRSPSDTRIPYPDPKWNPAEIARIGRRGSFQYDDYLEEMSKNGVNWARVWMCSWWGALEWRRDWPGYQGLNRYNLLNAWRIDHVLEVAEQKGIYVNLCLTNHGQFAPEVDTEWANNPYGAHLGGPLSAPREFFTSAEAKILHENKLRYVVARYGHSPAIMAWALFSEVEFTQGYLENMHNSQCVDTWHSEMATYLKSIDPNRHLVSTHFSHPQHGDDTLILPEIDLAMSNAYSVFKELTGGRPDAAVALSAYWSGNAQMQGFNRYGKPAVVEEQGRHFMGGHENSRVTLDADLHAGLWGSMVQPLSGATGYWWWLHLHFDQRWNEYQPLVRFMKGEDMRPAAGEQMLEPVELQATGATPLHGRALKSERRMYVWVYEEQLPLGGLAADVSDGTIVISGLNAGNYAVEFWDTHTGAVIQRGSISGDTSLKLPPFKGDIAIKIKPVK